MPNKIQARTIGEILDDVFRQYRNYFVPLFIISFVFLAPIIVLESLTSSQIPTLQYQTMLSGHVTFSQMFAAGRPSANTLFAGLAELLVGLLSMNIATPLTEGAYYTLTSDTLLQDRKNPSPWGYVRQAARRWGAYLATMWLMIGLAAVLFAVLFGLALISGKAQMPALSGILAFLFFVLAIVFIWLGIRLLFVFVAVFLERKRNWGAIARSFRLTSGSFWRLFGILVVAYLILGFAGAGLSAIFNLLLPINALRILSSGVVSILLAPLFNLLVGNLYIDLRIRREGYDIELHVNDQSANDRR